MLFALAASLRGTAAATRHVVWSVGLTGLVLLPLLSRVVPWRIEILPAAPPGAAGTIADTVIEPTASHHPVTSPPYIVGRNERDPAVARPITSPPESRSGISLVPGGFTLPDGATLRRAVSLLWILGVGTIVLRLALGIRAVRGITQCGVEPDAEWERAARRARARLRLGEPVRVVASGQVRLPYAAGFLRPVVVVPVVAGAWSADRRLAVLLHEFAHLKRGDVVPHLVAQLACAVCWFNPLVWIAARRLRAESERACDDLVLTSGARASDYAGHLLEIVRGAGRTWTPAHALPMAQPSEFEGRVLAILDAGVKRHATTPVTGVLVAAAITLLAVPLAAMGPARGDLPTPVSGAAAATADPVADEATEPTLRPENASVGAPTIPVRETRATHRLIEAIPLRSAEQTAEAGAAPDEERAPQPARLPRGAAAALVAALRDPVPAVRNEAARALGSLEDTTAMRALMRALREDTDAEVRRSAAWALGEMEDPRAIPALAAALTEDGDEAVRTMAAWALGEIEDARGIEALSVALRDPSAAVRQAAIQALGEIEDPGAIEGLTLALRDTIAEIRAKAAWALGEIEDARAVTALSAALRSDADAQVRRMTAWALGEIESATAVDALGLALRDGDLEVRRAALHALGEIEHPSAVPHILPLLRDSDPEVRRRAAWALGEIEDRRAVEPLMAAVKDADPRVREHVLWALGEIEDPRGRPALATALQDEFVAVRRKAAWALGELELRQAPPELIAALRDGDAQVRREAARALGEIGDAAAVPGLTALLADSDGQIKRTAVWALSEIHDPAAYEALVAALQDPDPEIRRLAARALGRRN